MIVSRMLSLIGPGVLGIALGLAQTASQTGQPNPAPASTGPAQAPTPAAPAPAPVWTVGPIDFSGMVDAYYSVNFNHPVSRTNQLRNFDVNGSQFSLNMAMLTMAHAPDPVGFQMDFGFGRTFEIIHSGEQAPEIFRYLKQAYVSLKPEQAKGFQVDFGKFVTSSGAEVIETQSNWNYSRSLLFSWAIPYYHFGLRTSIPLNKYFTAGVQVVNGWNNVDDNNTGKTVGLTAAVTTSKVSWSNNYYFGPEKSNTNKGLRQLYDTTLLLTPNTKTGVYLNFDYGRDKNVGPGASHWVGVAGAFRYSPVTWFALTPRLEWFNDANGFATGTAQKLKECTITGEFKMTQGLLARLEYRRDWSNQPFFDRGNTPGVYKNQDTLLLGVVAFFGPKR